MIADFFIDVLDGAIKGKQIPINKDKILVGRQTDCDLVLPNDALVSRKHALITQENSQVLIENLSQVNGVYINKNLISQKQVLKPGDEIIIGNHLMIFKTNTQSLSQKKDQPPATQAAQGSAQVQSQKPAALSPIAQANAPQTDDPKISSQDAVRRLFLLYQLSRATANRNPPDQLMKMILNFIFQDLRVQKGCILLLNSSANQLQPAAFKTRGADDPGFFFQPLQDFINIALSENKLCFWKKDQLQDWDLTGLAIIPLKEAGQMNALIYLDSTHPDFLLSKSDLEFLEALAHLASVSISKALLETQLKQHIQVIARLEKHVGSQVADIAKQYRVDLEQSELQTEEREVAILFSDIVGFTSLSEKLSASEIAFLLNGYFNHMADCVAKHHGYLNKYIGDAVMAVFGAPESVGNDSENATRCALEMLQRLKSFWKSIDESKRFQIRIGINTGMVVAGNIGSISRMEYTVLGDDVNLASRLESNAQPMTVMIGEATHEKVKGIFQFHDMGNIKVKGKAKPVKVFQVM